ncbi:hypothetical protein P5673_012574 [Acropora cervicornis]|uniref:Uncharacterized protein n=1 Tax=Acropora cervicornis TaxID=6130 RepID=A0AAD9QN19_ACRCE|nr:hypothetical protein P5673_012574 [Acropora cervicornis]
MLQSTSSQELKSHIERPLLLKITRLSLKQKYPSGSTSSDNDDDGALGSAHCAKGSKNKPRQGASKMSSLNMLSEKTNRKFEIKELELEVRRMELEF